MLALQAGAYHTQGVDKSASTPACAMAGAKPSHRHTNSFDVSQPNKSTLRPTLAASCKSQPCKALPGAVQVNLKGGLGCWQHRSGKGGGGGGQEKRPA